MLQLVGEFDDQDAVLADQSHQRHEADLRVNVETGALDAEHVLRRRHIARVEVDLREIVGARHAVVHKRGRQQLAVLIIDGTLVERLANAPQQQRDPDQRAQ